MATRRMDGLDPFLMVTTGGDVAHTAVTLWKDGELYVLESQYAWYLPKDERGIEFWHYDEWIAEAQDAGMHVVWLPLSDEYRAKFDSSKAWDFFN